MLTNKPIFRLLLDFSDVFYPPPLSPPSVVANNRAQFLLVGKPLKGEWL
jgi:hypothetical protein